MGLLGNLVSAGAAVFSKAEKIGGERLEPGRGPGAALLANPNMWSMGGHQYREKPHWASYDVLRYLCKRDTILASIILTRLRQVKSFARPRTEEEAEKTTTTGFRVKLKPGAGERGPAVQKREDELNMFMHRCGREDIQTQEPSFATFLWKFTKDRLEIDQPAAELRVDKKGDLTEFFAVDGATIRVVEPSKRETLKASYIQLYEGRPIASFHERELMFCPENISTELDYAGYGLAETEILVKQVMAHLGIDETNQRQFQPGSMPKGIITLRGADMSEEHVQLLQESWRAQVANPRGKHKLPFLPIPKTGQLDFVHFPQATDIEFGNFLDYLVNTMSALFGMDPAEINFPNRAGGIAGGSPMFSSSPEATRLTASRDKGLRTLLAYLEDCINWFLLPYIDQTEDFYFSFIGFDRQSDTERLDMESKQVQSYRTINEVRELRSLEPLEDGDIVLNPVFMQHKQAKEMMAQQLQQGEEGGSVGGEGEGQWTPTQGSTEQWGNPDEEGEGNLW